MIRWRVERVEAMPFGFNVRPVGEGKAEPAKDPYCLVEQLRERMDGAQVAVRARQRDVNRRKLARIRRPLPRLAPFPPARPETSWRSWFNSFPSRGRSSFATSRMPSLRREISPLLPRYWTRAASSELEIAGGLNGAERLGPQRFDPGFHRRICAMPVLPRAGGGADNAGQSLQAAFGPKAAFAFSTICLKAAAS